MTKTMKAKHIKSGDMIKPPMKNEPLTVQNVMTQETEGLSDKTREFLKGRILFTYNNSQKIVIPLESNVTLITLPID